MQKFGAIEFLSAVATPPRSWTIPGRWAAQMPIEWVRSIRNQCIAAKVAFHFKQWGGVNKKRTGRVLDGRTWDQLPKRHRAEHQIAFAE